MARTAPGSARQVALLRGVNVGGHNRVPMARLRALVEELGYSAVRTHLQSGNVLFTAPGTRPDAAAQAIRSRIADDLDLEIPVLVRTRDELAEVVDRNPLSEVASDPARFLVMFVSRAPDPELLAAIDPSAFEPEVFSVVGRTIYVWCPDGLRAIKLSYAFWEKRLDVTATGRNWNTVSRLLELADAPA